MKKWQENKISELGSRLAAILATKGINDIKNFEEAIGLQKDYVRYLIRGYKEGIGFIEGCKIAAALGIPPEELASGSGVSLIDIAPDAIKPLWYKMPGHFMEPNIANGSFLLVDYGLHNIHDPGVFLIELAGIPAIRRGAIRGNMFVTSVDNTAFSLTEEYPLDKLPKIVGKVIGAYKPL
jgi:hypothetical protein